MAGSPGPTLIGVLEFLIAVVVIAVIGLYLAWLAARVRRLRGRVQAARDALEAQLALRATRALQSDIGRLHDTALASGGAPGRLWKTAE